MPIPRHHHSQGLTPPCTAGIPGTLQATSRAETTGPAVHPAAGPERAVQPRAPSRSVSALAAGVSPVTETARPLLRSDTPPPLGVGARSEGSAQVPVSSPVLPGVCHHSEGWGIRQERGAENRGLCAPKVRGHAVTPPLTALLWVLGGWRRWPAQTPDSPSGGWCHRH